MLNKKNIWQQDISELCNSSNYKVKLIAAEELLNMAIDDITYRDLLTHIQSKGLLESLWMSLKPDTGQKLPGVDETMATLKMHLVALKILQVCSYQNPECLSNHKIITQDNIRYLFEMLGLDEFKGTHRHCCHSAAKSQWSSEEITTAQNIMCGKLFKAQLELSPYYSQHCDIYRVSLYQSDGTDIVKIMSDIGSVELCDIIEKLSDNCEKSVKVVHVISPDYVWVQLTDTSEQLTKLIGALSEYITTASPPLRTDSHVAVHVSDVNLVFRGQVMEWCEKNRLKVFAIDYGWTTTVPLSSTYGLMKELVEIPPHAVLCRLINIKSNSLLPEIQAYTLQILQDISISDVWSSTVIAHSQIHSIIKILKHSLNPHVLERVFLLLSQLSDNSRCKESLCNMFLVTSLNTAARCFFCPVVLHSALQFLRNLIIGKFDFNKNRFINAGGLKLVLKAHRVHISERLIQDHSLHILKFCLKEFEFEVVDEPLCVDNFKDLSVSNCVEKPKFSHMNNMRQYGIKESEHTSFVENCLKKPGMKVLCTQLVSFMNSKHAGVIYIGVSSSGIIKGLELNRQRKDDYLLTLDNVLTRMILNHKGVKVAGNCVDTSFETVENRHQQHLPEGTELALCVIKIKPSFFLAKLYQGETKYWTRGPDGPVPMTANQIRQKLVSSE